MRVCAVLMAIAVAVVARAADVTVAKPGGAKAGIDLTGLRAAGGEVPALVVRTIESDLVRSGWFVSAGKGAPLGVTGDCRQRGGQVEVSARVANAVTGQTYLSQAWDSPETGGRALAHRVADDIIWAVKKVKGISATRILLIGHDGKGAKDIYYCDADGATLTRVTRDGAPCLAPNWYPDAQSIIYTSLYRGYPDIYRIDLRSNRRDRIIAFPGMNMGARVSPDGRRTVMTLSKDGNPDLYAMDTGGTQVSRITRTAHAAEASPAWSPDGAELVFVSDGSGSPQIYTMPAGGGQATRISFQGSQNVAPDWGPDRRIAYASRRSGFFQICVFDPATKEDTQLTQLAVDHEDPSWAPDARHVVCSRNEGGRRGLYILDTLGDPPVRLLSVSGEGYSPAWSPR